MPEAAGYGMTMEGSEEDDNDMALEAGDDMAEEADDEL